MLKEGRKDHQREVLGLIASFLIIIIILIPYVLFGLTPLQIIRFPDKISIDVLREYCLVGISIEQCPNGDYIVGRYANIPDSATSYYTYNRFLIAEVGSRDYYYKTIIYYLRKLINQEIGCPEQELKNICQ